MQNDDNTFYPVNVPKTPEQGSESLTTTIKGTPELIGGVDETPTNVLKEAGKPPYLTEILEMGEAIEHFDMKDLVDNIDEFINEEIADGDRVKYNDLFDKLYKEAEIKDKDVYNIIEKVDMLVNIKKRTRQLIKDKEEFEAKDPEDMTAEELKRKLNGK